MSTVKLHAASVLVLIAFVLLALGSTDTAPPPSTSGRASAPATQLESAESEKARFSAKVLDAVGPPSPKWDKVRFDEISKSNFRLTILYRQTPSGYREIETDTKRVARAVLKVLIADGRDPHGEWISVFVHAHKPERGETGAALVRNFGRTSYDFNTDQLEFKPSR